MRHADVLINILLTLLGFIPGIIHAVYIILKVSSGLSCGVQDRFS